MELTRKQQAIIDVLSDGKAHTYIDLISHADVANVPSLKAHVHQLRKILRPLKQDILCLNLGSQRQGMYQQVALLSQGVPTYLPNNGKN